MSKFHQTANPGKPQNRPTVLSPIPIDAKSRAVSKKVLTLAVARKAKKLEQFEVFADRLSENTDLIGEIYLYQRSEIHTWEVKYQCVQVPRDSRTNEFTTLGRWVCIQGFLTKYHQENTHTHTHTTMQIEIKMTNVAVS